MVPGTSFPERDKPAALSSLGNWEGRAVVGITTANTLLSVDSISWVLVAFCRRSAVAKCFIKANSFVAGAFLPVGKSDAFGNATVFAFPEVFTKTRSADVEDLLGILRGEGGFPEAIFLGILLGKTCQ